MTTDKPKTQACHILTLINGKTEELMDLIEIKGFDLNKFCVQFDVPVESDPEMLDRYAVGPDDAQFVIDAIGVVIAFDFAKYAYFIEAAERH